MTPAADSTSITEAIDRIDIVLRENRRLEHIYLALTIILFITGIAFLLVSIRSGQLAHSITAVVAEVLLIAPLREIKTLRRKNVALATAPALIGLLPPTKAAKQLEKLLTSLYGDD